MRQQARSQGSWDGTRTPLVLQAVPSASPSAAELAAYAGRFTSAELGSTWMVRRAGEGLRVTPATGRVPVGLLRPAGRDAFSDYEYVLVIFRRDGQGRVTGLDVSTPRVQNLRFAKRSP